jgi:hypothetical protein
MDQDQAKFAANEPITQKIRSWDRKELLPWVKQKLMLEPDDEKKFKKAKINGNTFLECGTDITFFMKAKIPIGISYELSELAKMFSSKKSTPFIMDITQTTGLQCHRGQRASWDYGSTRC